jgi:hypothetical protein
VTVPRNFLALSRASFASGIIGLIQFRQAVPTEMLVRLVTARTFTANLLPRRSARRNIGIDATLRPDAGTYCGK